MNAQQINAQKIRERNIMQRMWKPTPNDGAILTRSHIMPPYQWNRMPNGRVISAATPDYFPDKKPVAFTGKYFIYEASPGATGEALRYRARI